MQIVENAGAESSGSQILHPGSRKLFCHWEALRAERPCPTREEFSLADIRDIVPDLVILERDHIRKSFRYRLAGSNVCELMKSNLTGTDVLAGWENFERDVISKHLIQTVSNLQPTLFRARLTTDTRQQVAAEFIGLPIRMRGSERLEIIGGMFPFRPALAIGHNAIVSRELLAIRSVWTEYKNVTTGIPVPTERRFKVIHGGLSA
ncbi:MAG: PAS domain-containing protein [Phyllobacteriaceae bacterium]|nr:PAS domain-containing protein [Phyllobacteriaceae bacterium]